MPSPHAPSPRLIEAWFPVNQTSIEAIREGGALAGHPPVNQLHVWWARRPLAISRAAVAASVLNADADRDMLLQTLGTSDKVVQERRAMDAAKARGEWSNIKFSNKRAFTHNPTPAQAAWLHDNLAAPDPVTLDVTAGGGSIPFEAGRLGLRTIANELNPVAAIILRATCEWPQTHGAALLEHFGAQANAAAEWTGIAGRFLRRVAELTQGVYPPEPQPDWMREWNDFHAKEICSNSEKTKIVRAQRYVWSYLWARTVACPSCDRNIPLSPNWRLTKAGSATNPKPKIATRKDGSRVEIPPSNDQPGLGVRLLPDESAGICGFEIVNGAANYSQGTVSRGNATCPYPSCGSTTPRGYLAQEASAGRMGHQLYGVIYRDSWQEYTKTGAVKKRLSTQRHFRVTTPDDDNSAEILRRLAELKPKWDAEDVLPGEIISDGNKTNTLLQYGMPVWNKLFSSRQQLAHGVCVQAYRELVDEDRDKGILDDALKAAWCYIGLALDKMINRNSLLCMWDPGTSKVAQTFATHDFGMKWSYAEMAVTVQGLGLEWAIRDMRKCINEVVDFTHHEKPRTPVATAAVPGEFGLIPDGMLPIQTPPESAFAAAPSVVLNGAAQALDMDDASVDAVVFDPPYHDNVNYAELSDFFFVWLKRTAGYALGEEFPRAYLTDKTNEAIASPARFRAQASRERGSAQSARNLATDDYHAKMREIFGECRRVVKPDGIMTVMFTHKSTAAWDALTMALIESGFAITRTWPVKTEAESSLNISGNAAARSTILLACRPMERDPYPVKSWEQVEVEIAAAVREDIETLQTYGLTPVDMHLAAFGPALRVISENWGTEREQAHPDRYYEPFKVTPTDAMQVARREVMDHRVKVISQSWAEGTSDALTRFYILGQDGLGAAVAPFDDANLFARAIGVEIDDAQSAGLVEVKSGKVTFLSAKERLQRGHIGDGARARASAWIDIVHTAIALAERGGVEAAGNWLRARFVDAESGDFKGALEALLRIMRRSEDDYQPALNLWRYLYEDAPPERLEAQLELELDGPDASDADES